MKPQVQQPSVGGLLKELATETGTLVRQEMALARAEMLDKTKSAVKSTALVMTGAAIAHAALLAFIAALLLGLGAVVPQWLSALLISVVLAAVGMVLARSGLARLRRLDPLPERTLDSIKQVMTLRAAPAPAEQWGKEEQAP